MFGKILVNSSLKKEYLLKNGVVNTDLIGGFVLPTGKLTSKGIEFNLGGGYYNYAIKTQIPYTLNYDDMMIYECEGSFSSAMYLPKSNMILQGISQCGIGKNKSWRMVWSLSNGYDQLELTDLMHLMSANDANHFRFTIKNIYIIRNFSGGGGTKYPIKFLREIFKKVGEFYVG